MHPYKQPLFWLLQFVVPSSWSASIGLAEGFGSGLILTGSGSNFSGSRSKKKNRIRIANPESLSHQNFIFNIFFRFLLVFFVLILQFEYLVSGYSNRIHWNLKTGSRRKKNRVLPDQDPKPCCLSFALFSLHLYEQAHWEKKSLSIERNSQNSFYSK